MSVAVSNAYQNTQAKPAMPERRHQVIITPTSQVPSDSNPVGGGNTIEWLSIPTSAAAAGSFISTEESYLELTVRCHVATDTKTAQLNKAGIRGLIERVQVHSSGYVVEDSNFHNKLLALLEDVNMKRERRTGYQGMINGYFSRDTDNQLNTTKGAAFVGGTGKVTRSLVFRLPLVGHFWNSIKMLPVHQITDLAYRLQLASDIEGVVSPTNNDDEALGYEITHAALNLTYVEVSPSNKQMLTQRAGSSWSSPCWEVLRDNVEGAALSTTLRIPSAKSSTKTLAISFRSKDCTDNDENKKADVDCMSRLFPKVKDYQFQVNGMLVPQNPVAGSKGALIQMKRAFHDLDGDSIAIMANTWANATQAAKYEDTYFIAETFENYGKSNSTFSGMNTLAANPLCKINFSAAVADGGLDVFYYVQYDMRYEIQNGVVRPSY